MDKEETLPRVITLEEGKDMTLSRFIQWLNENFKKISKKQFTPQDAYGYIKRGNLPYHFGIYKLEERDYPEVGLKIITVTNLNKK